MRKNQSTDQELECKGTCSAAISNGKKQWFSLKWKQIKTSWSFGETCKAFNQAKEYNTVVKGSNIEGSLYMHVLTHSGYRKQPY